MSITATMENIVPMSIYTVLKGEHEEVNVLLKSLNAAPESMENGREAIFDKIRNELLSHVKAEEETVYREFAEKSEKKKLIVDAEEEHEKVEQLLNELDGMDLTSAEAKLKIASLKENIEHHVHEEEGNLFDQMRQVFTEEDEKRLGKNFLESKKMHLE